jgi:hypothetical protein
MLNILIDMRKVEHITQHCSKDQVSNLESPMPKAKSRRAAAAPALDLIKTRADWQTAVTEL